MFFYQQQIEFNSRLKLLLVFRLQERPREGLHPGIWLLLQQGKKLRSNLAAFRAEYIADRRKISLVQRAIREHGSGDAPGIVPPIPQEGNREFPVRRIAVRLEKMPHQAPAQIGVHLICQLCEFFDHRSVHIHGGETHHTQKHLLPVQRDAGEWKGITLEGLFFRADPIQQRDQHIEGCPSLRGVPGEIRIRQRAKRPFLPVGWTAPQLPSVGQTQEHPGQYFGIFLIQMADCQTQLINRSVCAQTGIGLGEHIPAQHPAPRLRVCHKAAHFPSHSLHIPTAQPPQSEIDRHAVIALEVTLPGVLVRKTVEGQRSKLFPDSGATVIIGQSRPGVQRAKGAGKTEEILLHAEGEDLLKGLQLSSVGTLKNSLAQSLLEPGGFQHAQQQTQEFFIPAEDHGLDQIPREDDGLVFSKKRLTHNDMNRLVSLPQMQSRQPVKAENLTVVAAEQFREGQLAVVQPYHRWQHLNSPREKMRKAGGSIAPAESRVGNLPLHSQAQQCRNPGGIVLICQSGDSRLQRRAPEFLWCFHFSQRDGIQARQLFGKRLNLIGNENCLVHGVHAVYQGGAKWVRAMFKARRLPAPDVKFNFRSFGHGLYPLLPHAPCQKGQAQDRNLRAGVKIGITIQLGDFVVLQKHSDQAVLPGLYGVGDGLFLIRHAIGINPSKGDFALSRLRLHGFRR